jgi:deoxyxylulose-5-phosphate synthase
MNKQDLIDFENKIAQHYRDNKLPFIFHLSGGNEDELIEIFKEIKPGDYVFSNHRGHYHALLHGIPPDVLEEHILNGRSMFIYDRERNYFTTAIIGGAPAIAAGVALALKKKGSTQRVWCFVGDGNEDTGHLFEAARYVEGFDLPCTFIIESNGISVNTSNQERWGSAHNLKWDFKCIKKYFYTRTQPHIRIDEFMDFSKAVDKGNDDTHFPIKANYSENLQALVRTNISYKDAITNAMTDLGNSGSIFIGYCTKHGNAMSTLNKVDDSLKLETPVAENLMMGLAIGLSFEGFKPVVYFERHDFMLIALDALINHADKIYRLSHGQFTVPVVIRAVCAQGGPFYSGPTHSQDFTAMFKSALTCNVYDPKDGFEMFAAYEDAKTSNHPVVIIERKTLY